MEERARQERAEREEREERELPVFSGKLYINHFYNR